MALPIRAVLYYHPLSAIYKAGLLVLASANLSRGAPFSPENKWPWFIWGLVTGLAYLWPVIVRLRPTDGAKLLRSVRGASRCAWWGLFEVLAWALLAVPMHRDALSAGAAPHLVTVRMVTPIWLPVGFLVGFLVGFPWLWRKWIAFNEAYNRLAASDSAGITALLPPQNTEPAKP